MINNFKAWWFFLIGHEEDLSIENRTFNAVSLICFLYLAIMFSVNIALGLFTMAKWISMMMLLLSVLFYISRFTNRFKLASCIFAILSYPTVAGVYILNAGLSGPGVYGFLLSFVLLIVTTPPRSHLIWFFLHSLFICGLFYIELTHPKWIVLPYQNRTDHVIDLSFSFIPVLMFMYVASSFLRKGYIREKQLASNLLDDINSKKKELEYINKEKDRLFSIIGHDLRSPLNSIQGYLDILDSTDLPAEDRLEIQTQLSELTSNTSHLLNNLLLWSSKSADSIHLQELEVCALCEEVVNLLRPQAFKKGISITHNLGDGPVSALADKDMLQVVIRNLLSNAVKFTPEKGSIELTCIEDGGKVSISIKDNGFGIPPEKQKDIFSSRVKSSRGTAEEPGIGLGLVLCHDFITALGGSLNFESEVNMGSTFVVTLNQA